MKKLMIIGSHKYFENIVQAAKEEGIYTIVCDGREDAPAKLICDEAINVDILDLNKLKSIAIEKNIDGVMTSFTDELLEPYAYIAKELGLPCVIEYEQLDSVTNKILMKEILEKNNINSPKYTILNNLDEISKVDELKFPLVLKPVDSCGSKGVYFVNNINELIHNFKNSRNYSKDGRVIVEEFYESDEIQGLAWVKNGECKLLYVGDRELVNIHEGRTGKPRRLLYPSVYCYQYERELEQISQNIAKAFNISNGPIYIQFFIGKDGIKVNEMMTRLPGGCDYLAIKECTGFDIAKLMVKFCVDDIIDFEEVKNVKMNLDKCPYILPIYLKEGIVGSIRGVDKIKKMKGVYEIFFDLKEGDYISASGDMRQSVGRIFGIANNIYEAKIMTKYIHSIIKIEDRDGKNMIDNF